MSPEATYWITRLHLTAHPEGGYFRQTYYSPDIISAAALPDRYQANRAVATAIYFLVAAPQVSKFHRLRSDELWLYHAGYPLTISAITPEGGLRQFILGLDLDNGAVPQVCISQGWWFGAAVNDPQGYTLVSCIVAPGFDFADFELADRAQLVSAYPQHHTMIHRLT